MFFLPFAAHRMGGIFSNPKQVLWLSHDGLFILCSSFSGLLIHYEVFSLHKVTPYLMKHPY